MGVAHRPGHVERTTAAHHLLEQRIARFVEVEHQRHHRTLDAVSRRRRDRRA
jgi:hypothetical protein